jgi:hypothetical protein
MKGIAIFHAGSEEEIDSAFARMAQSRRFWTMAARLEKPSCPAGRLE